MSNTMTATEVRSLIFPSAVGWNLINHTVGVIDRVLIGFQQQADAVKHACQRDLNLLSTSERNQAEEDWVQLFSNYAKGREVDFSEIEIDQSWMTPFQRRCVNACRRIDYGQTVSYGSLAKTIGSPGAARAVGTVMRTNRFPLIVPCHRVVAASGIGGFSAPTGVALKQRLLAMESQS